MCLTEEARVHVYIFGFNPMATIGTNNPAVRNTTAVSFEMLWPNIY